MAKKLTFFLKSRIPWPLAFKTVGAALAAAGLWFSDFHWLATAIFWVFFGATYFSESFQRRSLRYSYWFLAISGFFLVKIGLTASWPLLLSFILLLVFLSFFFVILGLMNFFFSDRFLIFNLFQSSFFLAFFSVFFYFQPTASPAAILGLTPCVFLLLQEFFDFNGVIWPKRRFLAAGVLSLVGTQVFWTAAFLPIGFINSAAFLALFISMARDAFLAHFRGHFSVPYLLRQLTIFVVLVLFIFAISQWSL